MQRGQRRRDQRPASAWRATQPPSAIGAASTAGSSGSWGSTRRPSASGRACGRQGDARGTGGRPRSANSSRTSRSPSLGEAEGGEQVVGLVGRGLGAVGRPRADPGRARRRTRRPPRGPSPQRREARRLTRSARSRRTTSSQVRTPETRQQGERGDAGVGPEGVLGRAPDARGQRREAGRREQQRHRQLLHRRQQHQPRAGGEPGRHQRQVDRRQARQAAAPQGAGGVVQAPGHARGRDLRRGPARGPRSGGRRRPPAAGGSGRARRSRPGARSVQNASASAITRPGSAKPPITSAAAPPPTRPRWRAVRNATGSTTATATSAAATLATDVLSAGSTSRAGVGDQRVRPASCPPRRRARSSRPAPPPAPRAPGPSSAADERQRRRRASAPGRRSGRGPPGARRCRVPPATRRWATTTTIASSPSARLRATATARVEQVVGVDRPGQGVVAQQLHGAEVGDDVEEHQQRPGGDRRPRLRQHHRARRSPRARARAGGPTPRSAGGSWRSRAATGR